MSKITVLDYYKENDIAVAFLSDRIWRTRRCDGREWVIEGVTTASMDFKEREFSGLQSFYDHVKALPSMAMYPMHKSDATWLA